MKQRTFLLICFYSLLASISYADSIRIESIEANGLSFRCRTAGNAASDRTVILLHGFPESAHMWESTLLLLAQKGYYCIAPDLRGYSPKARPKGIKNYCIHQLAKDVILIAKAKGVQKFHLVGHDWGAAIGWAICGKFPGQIQSFVPLSVPHLSALASALKNDKEQRKMSAYAQFFQLPVWPEIVMKAKQFKQLKKTCWYLSTPKQIEAYQDVFSSPKALRSCLHYYRKNWNKMSQIASDLAIDSFHIPTTFIWGKNDTALGATASKSAQKYMKGPYRFIVLDASHWLIQEKESEVHSILLQHLEDPNWFTKRN